MVISPTPLILVAKHLPLTFPLQNFPVSYFREVVQNSPDIQKWIAENAHDPGVAEWIAEQAFQKSLASAASSGVRDKIAEVLSSEVGQELARHGLKEVAMAGWNWLTSPDGGQTVLGTMMSFFGLG